MTAACESGDSGTTSGKYRISRTGNTDSYLWVFYTMIGYATNGTDYYNLPGYVKILPGLSYTEISLTPYNDLKYEGPETATLVINSDITYNRGSSYFDTITIYDSCID